MADDKTADTPRPSEASTGKVADVAPGDAAASPPERPIRDSEARYRALFESTGDAIVLMDVT
ncbi:MAG: hypothetical protein ACC645_21920, partial [Pirellulales bacterium]